MKSLKSVLGLIFILALANPLCSEASSEKNPLAPVKTDNPRATMRSFYTAMESYHQGLEENDPQLEAKITDAIRCLDTSTLAALTRSTEAVDAAIYLKEVLDRVIVLNYSLIPDDSEQDFWRLKDTEISTRRITEGDRSGEHLITSATVERAGEFFKKVEDLPYLKGAGQGAGYKEPLLQRMLPTWSTDTFAEIAYWQWIGLFFSLLLGLVVRLFARLIGNLIHAFTKKTATQWDDILIESQIGPVSLLVASLIWLSALQILKFEGFVMTVLSGMTQIVLVSSMIWVAYRLADVLAQYLKDVASRTENTLDDQIVKLISRTLKIFIVIMGVMLGAQNLGIDVFSLLAGLGIGGLAIALAAKDSLSNFFGSIMIMVDRPFQVGQWIKVGNIDGTVEDVGFRSTKIRTFYNSLVSIPNAEVANSDIDNMGLREYRRVKTTLGVAYDTPAEKMEAFLEGIKNIIKANPNTRKDYFHVVFNDFGPSSLDIMLYFFVKVANWSDELVERQNVFLEIIRLAESLEVEFAFPTQTIHVKDLPGNPPHDPQHNRDQAYLAEKSKEYGPNAPHSRPGGSGLFTPPHKDPDLS